MIQHMHTYLVLIASYIISVPARIKGMKIGKNVIMGPGYNFVSSDFRNVEVGKGVIIGISNNNLTCVFEGHGVKSVETASCSAIS